MRPATQCAVVLFRVAGSTGPDHTKAGSAAELVASRQARNLVTALGEDAPKRALRQFTYSSNNLYQLAYQLARDPEPPELSLQAEPRSSLELRHCPHVSSCVVRDSIRALLDLEASCRAFVPPFSAPDARSATGAANRHVPPSSVSLRLSPRVEPSTSVPRRLVGRAGWRDWARLLRQGSCNQPLFVSWNGAGLAECCASAATPVELPWASQLSHLT